MYMARDEKLLVFFPDSSTLYVKDLTGRKPTRKFRIWPEQALKLLKAHYEKDKIGNCTLFLGIIIDRDHSGIIYLPSWENKNIGGLSIYKMNLDGQLVGVLYIPFMDRGLYPRLLLKQNNIFVYREDEKIIFYREVKK